MQISGARLGNPPKETYEKIRLIPKADQHAHLMLSAPASSYNFAGPRLRKAFAGYTDFASYLQSEVLPVINSVEYRVRVVEAAFQSWIEDGVCYVETSLDVMSVLACQDKWPEFLASFLALTDRYSGQLKVSLELGFSRDNKIELRQTVKQLLQQGLFKGVDLYGAENAASVKDFSWFFNCARECGCYIKLHTGEQSNWQKMKEEFLIVEPDAVQHGLAAINDFDLIELLVKKNIRLNLAPASNIALGYCTDYQNHPLPELLRRGVDVAIGSDDLAIFNSSISQQLASFVELGLLDFAQVEQICAKRGTAKRAT